MSFNSTIDKTFQNIDYTQNVIDKGEFENCVFSQCNFEGVDLSQNIFIDCTFSSCNLSLSKLTKTAFRDVSFKDCKLLGLRFENCNDFLFEVRFENCILNLSSFYKRNSKKTLFNNCSLQEVDFSEADLSGSTFNNCNLSKAIFDNCNLEKVDFRTAFNYSISPERNRIKKAKFSSQGLAGLLQHYDIIID